MNYQYYGVYDKTLMSNFTDWRVVKMRAKNDTFKLIIDDTVKFAEAYTVPIYSMGFSDISSWSPYLSLDYYKIYDNNDSLIFYQEFNDCGNNPIVYKSCLPDCNTLFTQYMNQQLGTNYNYSQLQCIFQQRLGIDINPCQSGPTLCRSPDPVFGPVKPPSVTPCADSTLFSVGVGTKLYEAYRDSLLNSFNDRYLEKCLGARYHESFKVTAPISEFHYTLYYYDQAGNLVKTVPPAGVDVSKFNWAVAYRDSVKAAINNGTQLTPVHGLSTQYRYNTLNQVVAQSTPDGGTSKFWYDRLGRLVISQNAKQKANSVTEENALYSYTKYDYLGRISQVGQIKNNDGAEPVTDALTRSITSLDDWLTDRNTVRGQITETTYDLKYSGFAGQESNTIWQRNLRNRVSYTTFTDSASLSGYNQATFYTYDIHGNVDTLLQDYGASSVVANIMNVQTTNANRWKRMVYKYDLISGKVNHVAYQPPRGNTYYPDMFYHRYSYDAENRLILAETSMDSVVWEKESRYDYYAHGPLARSVLGEQLVQGTDYAYTLQGWLKGVNSTSNYNGVYDMGNDGNASAANQYVARDALGFNLNYFSGDYLAINSGVNPFPGSSAYTQSKYWPLYTGNISSIAVNIRFPGPTTVQVPQLYAYKYDQLNRVTAMEVIRGLNESSNSWSSPDTTITDYKEGVAYDPNGNILKYLRNGISSVNTNMDSLHYNYYSGTNQLKQVRDAVSDNNYTKANGTEDIDDQTSSTNYTYDPIGNLISDAKDSITLVKWNVYGKIAEIQRTASGARPVNNIKYTYDASGNRISKRVQRYDNDTLSYTWYARDASGNVMATYSSRGIGDLTSSNYTLRLGEQDMYGSSRLGIVNRDISITSSFTRPTIVNFIRGNKFFELTNHLGNVLLTISDKKVGHDGGSGVIDYFNPDIITANDYYPFGMMMPGRKYVAGSVYRYGFNGKENDNDVKGEGNQQDYGLRIYDPRLGKLLSIDPLSGKFPDLSTYQFAANRPIDGIDILGLQWWKAVGNWMYNNTLYGLITNSVNTVKAAAKGDDRAIMALVSYSGSKLMEGKEAFGKNGTKDQKEEFVTGLLLDAATAYVLPKLVNGKAPNATKMVSEETAASTSKPSISTGPNKQAIATNGGNTNAVENNVQATVPILDKVGRRKAYAQNTFTTAGKNSKDVNSLMNTVDFSRAVREKIFNAGDKVYRFERINSKGGEQHFYTDAAGADAGPTGVGFKAPDGYKLVTYEVTQKTSAMESTIKGTANKQYFSTELQKSLKKVGEE